MGDGLNSDYYPVVDQSAPLARFVGHAADGLMRTVTAPVPLVELLGDAGPPATIATPSSAAPAKRNYAELAVDALAFLRTGTSSGTTAMRLRDNGLLRAVVYECATLPAGMAMRELMLPLANVVNPMVPRQDAVAMWEGLSSAKCPSAIRGRDREWLDLFAAVGARNAARMAELGTRLAKEESEDDFRAYAVMAGAAGLIAADRLPEAVAFLDVMSGRLSPAAQRDPPMRLLAVLARTGLPKPAEVASRSGW
jgi:hypothetical protein